MLQYLLTFASYVFYMSGSKKQADYSPLTFSLGGNKFPHKERGRIKISIVAFTEKLNMYHTTGH